MTTDGTVEAGAGWKPGAPKAEAGAPGRDAGAPKAEAGSETGAPGRDAGVPAGRHTLVGVTAILLWATLASLTALTGTLPPFQLLAMTFGIGALIGLGLSLRQGGSVLAPLRLPLRVWLLGIYGLFGYHLFYFVALRHAPAVEANLLNYLWPLLIVLFSSLLPGGRLRWNHVAGGLVGFAGAALLVTGGRSLTLEPRYVLGYLAALACALIWSSYSVLLKRFGSVPTRAVGGFCAVTALLAALCHVLFERTVWPVGGQWLAVLGMGLGPMGAAFYTWDDGIKRGSVVTLGALSYVTPLLSTLLLLALGLAKPNSLIALACGCIVGGATLAAWGTWRRKT